MSRSALFVLPLLLLSQSLAGQAAEHRAELWGAYISSIPLQGPWSLWADFHSVPQAFVVARPGLSYQAGSQHRFTAGYAYVRTALPAKRRLERDEHRPWAQYEYFIAPGQALGGRVRLRYDRRIRQDYEPSGISSDSWSAYNRWRLMLSLRQKLKLGGHKGHSLHLMNEYLLNQGGDYAWGSLDQNRSYLLWGYSLNPHSRLMGGYYLRSLPDARYRHGFSLWFIHNWQRQRPDPLP